MNLQIRSNQSWTRVLGVFVRRRWPSWDPGALGWRGKRRWRWEVKREHGPGREKRARTKPSHRIYLLGSPERTRWLCSVLLNHQNRNLRQTRMPMKEVSSIVLWKAKKVAEPVAEEVPLISKTGKRTRLFGKRAVWISDIRWNGATAKSTVPAKEDSSRELSVWICSERNTCQEKEPDTEG